jgi:N-acetylmuramoyl-L-alanine amidase
MKVTGGTSGRWTKYPEYKANLAVAKKLAHELRSNGYTVYMTRTSNKVNISNVQRAKFANSKKANLVIRLHCDGSTSSATRGFLTLTPAKTKHTAKFYAKSLKAAKVIHKAVLKTTKAYNRGIVKRSDLTAFNWSKVPVVLFEMGVMTNKSDDYKLASAKYQGKLAKGMANGVNRYFKK